MTHFQSCDPPQEIPTEKQRLIDLFQKLGFDGPVWFRKSLNQPRYAEFRLHDFSNEFFVVKIRMDNMNATHAMKILMQYNHELENRFLREFYEFMAEKLEN